MFALTKKEWKSLRCNFSTSKSRGGLRYMPFAFTEQRVSMLSGILNSIKAITVNIAIIRAFVALRQFALSHKELAGKIAKLERKYNKRFKDVHEALDYLLREKQNEKEWKDRERIGFKK